MKPCRFRVLRPALPFLLAAALPGAALAHPHVSVSVRTAVLVDDAGEITALRHAWTFDEAFSAYSTQGLDKNGDGRLDREELAELAKINVESLHEYGFFSVLRQGKTSAEFGAVQDYHLDHDGKALTLHFTLPVSARRLPVREARLEVYDPSYFVAFEFAAAQAGKAPPVTVEGGRATCAARIKPPPAGVTQRLSQLSESFFQSMKAGAESEWASPVTFECR